MHMRKYSLTAALIVTVGVLISAQGQRRVALGDWPEARGPNGDGVSKETGLVEKWALNGQNFLWRAPYGGRSAPIVMGNRVYVQNAAGRGTATHLAGELFNLMAGTKLVAVHYKGGGETIKDLVSGQVKVMFSTIPPVLGLVKDGTGSLLLGGTNNFSGVTDLQQGTLLVGKPSSLGTSILQMDGGTFGGSGGAISLNNDVVISSDSTIGGSQNLTFSGHISAEGATLRLKLPLPARW